MFCIIAPVLVSPIIATLFYADHKAKQAGELSFAASRLKARTAIEAGTMQIQRQSLSNRLATFRSLLTQIDLIGLLLLPFSLARDAQGGWSNPSMIAMITVGFVILLLFLAWEILLSRYPILNRRVWHNKTFLCAVVIDIFYMISGNVRSTYYTTWVLLIKPWSTYNWGNFVAITTVSLTFFGLLAGLYHRLFHRYKLLQLFGLSLRLLALGITYWAVGPHATTPALVFSQLLNAAAGACSVVGTRVASQASVPHQDLAPIIAQLSLWTKLGSSVGSAISSHMYTSTYTANLLAQGLSAEDAAVFYGSSTTARNTFAWAGAEREAGIRAFTETVRPMFLVGLCLAVVPLLAGLMMPDYYLGKAQNVVDGTGNGGVVVVVVEEQAQVGAGGRGGVERGIFFLS
ncbi:hypothetical protein BJX64DRAFT_293217 [Aspergillus heterothallicus]